MAEPYIVTGPVRRGYTDENTPIIQSSDVSGVALVENITYSNGSLNIPYLDHDGNSRTKVVPVDTSPTVSVLKGFCAVETIADNTESTAISLARTAYLANNYTNEVLNNPKDGSLVRFTSPRSNPPSFYRPFVLIPKVHNENLRFLFNLESNLTSFWKNAGDYNVNNASYTLWVSIVQYPPNEKFDVLLRSYL